MAGLQLTRLYVTKEENMLLFVCSQAVDFKQVKLVTSHAVILPPTDHVNVTLAKHP